MNISHPHRPGFRIRDPKKEDLPTIINLSPYSDLFARRRFFIATSLDSDTESPTEIHRSLDATASASPSSTYTTTIPATPPSPWADDAPHASHSDHNTVPRRAPMWSHLQRHPPPPQNKDTPLAYIFFYPLGASTSHPMKTLFARYLHQLPKDEVTVVVLDLFVAAGWEGKGVERMLLERVQIWTGWNDYKEVRVVPMVGRGLREELEGAGVSGCAGWEFEGENSEEVGR